MEQYPILLEEQTAHGHASFPCVVYIIDAPPANAEKIYCHWHHELELLLILEGNAFLHINSEKHPLTAGDFVWIPSNTVHMVLGESDKTFRFIAVVFHPDFIRSFGNDVIQEKYIAPLLKWQFDCSFVFNNVYSYQKLVVDIASGYQEKMTGYELFIKTRLMELFLLMYQDLQNCQLQKHQAKDYRTTLAKDMMLYLQKQYNETVTLSEMAKHFHISEGHLCRFFKEMTNMPPIGYLNYFRINKSAQLLRDTNLPISTIAGQTGFNNISYYNRIFRKYMHMTPNTYRKGIDQNN